MRRKWSNLASLSSEPNGNGETLRDHQGTGRQSHHMIFGAAAEVMPRGHMFHPAIFEPVPGRQEEAAVRLRVDVIVYRVSAKGVYTTIASKVCVTTWARVKACRSRSRVQCTENIYVCRIYASRGISCFYAFDKFSGGSLSVYQGTFLLVS